ncbi:MAG: GNAT family acetyltransferase [Alphaproteobacteria bacterium]|nr:GNAT family acetyltransferase [Alphaproteobacteria bacterium]
MGRRPVAIRAIGDDDVEAVVALWGRCGLTRPWNDPYRDIDLARRTPHADVLALVEAGKVVGAVMVGHDGHRGTVYYLGVAPERAGAGRGRALMTAAEAWLRERGVWKINLLVRERNAAVLGFYAALGYGDQECRVLGKRLDGRADRTPPGRRRD